jgi:hypothetical protein
MSWRMSACPASWRLQGAAGLLATLRTTVSRPSSKRGRSDDERGQGCAVSSTGCASGMRLQSDPTVIYGLGAAYDGDIRSRDLVTDTPYNSCHARQACHRPGGARWPRYGLHYPDKLPAIYFVATGSGDGSHYFSATLSEHNACYALPAEDAGRGPSALGRQ